MNLLFIILLIKEAIMPTRRRRLLNRAVVLPIALFGFSVSLAQAQATSKKPFTISDSIEMVRLADPEVAHIPLGSSEIKLSPDGRKFVIVTRTGNLKTGLNEYRLLLYDAGEVRDGIGRAGLPAPVMLARFDTSSNRPGIAQTRWLKDSRTIAFLGENPREAPQIYTVDTGTKKLRKLTNHPTPILDFDLNLKSRRFIYAAHTPPDWSQKIARGYAVGTDMIIDVIGKGREQLRTRIAFFIGQTDGKFLKAVEMQPYNIGSNPWGFWLSPTGRWAVAVNHVAPAPAEWWSYEPVTKDPYYREGNDPAIASFTVAHQLFFLQYMLVNMETGKWSPLFDAPVGLFSNGRPDADWSPDESSVILNNTFLPLKTTDSEELARRRVSSSIVEVDMKTRTPHRIVDLVRKDDPSRGGRRPVRLVLNAEGVLTVNWRGDAKPTVYRKSGGRWIEGAGKEVVPPLSVSVAQGLNQPPELLTTETATGRSKIITDLNPQFRHLTLGEVETITWKDAKGREWRGGLLKPINYVSGKRYPLVIQTHGYNPEAFLLDGPADASGYGARALANKDMVVVQMQDMGPYGFREELEKHVVSYAALIDLLDKKDLIDRNRVGIHGFSRTGFHVQHALTFSDLKFAAASVSDASGLSAFNYVIFYGFSHPGMVEFERMIGVPLWGEENAETWAERDPTFHLERLKTPLRIEVNSHAVGGWWETYAILRRHQRPVEYIFFPDGAHQLFKPWERLTSQQGTVDWYDFWLNHREDSAPAKQEQYKQWRILRTWHEANMSGKDKKKNTDNLR